MIPRRDHNPVLDKFKIIGVFEGECADSNITNENGLDIPRLVWEMVFSSEQYKKALSLGWYIGFLGHPEDPGCMDFEHACIVMTDGWIDNEGKVHGKFNLIDTPVGRIVKAFIDAGVVFGISVRGAGDIINNVVDADTFVFRGFDLVTFPAFPESIPVFTEIAASSDINKQRQYKAVCAALSSNLAYITDNRTLNMLDSLFASQSKERSKIQDRLNEVHDNVHIQKIEAMTNLYIEATDKVHKLSIENEKLKAQAAHDKSRYSRRNRAVDRIVASQLESAEEECMQLNSELRTSIAANKELKSENLRLNEKVQILTSSNLKYKKKIQSGQSEISRQKEIVCATQMKLDETVNKQKSADSRASNLGEQVSTLKSKLSEYENRLREYQTAYAALYVNAVGLSAVDIPISADMSVEKMKSYIASSASIDYETDNVVDEVSYVGDSIDDDNIVVV